MIPQLMQASLEGAVAAGIAWLLCRFAPKLPASIKTWVWCAVAAKFLATLVWTTPLTLPVLPPTHTQLLNQLNKPNKINKFNEAALTGPSTPFVTSVVASSATATPAVSAADTALWVSGAAFAIWLTGVLVATGFGARRWQRARQIIRRSTPAPESLTDTMADVAIRMGLAEPPAVRLSDDVSSPLVVGAGRATVIIPSQQFTTWSSVEQRMAMARECAHIRRADLRIGCVPAMCEALFFFHPLARMAAREYALWREAACDAEVISALDLEPADYGRLLVSFGVSQPRVGLAAGSASRSASHLKRRLLMLTENASPSLRSRVTAGVIALAALLATVPVRLTARADLAPMETRIESGVGQFPAIPPAPPAPPAPPSRARLAPPPPAPPSPAELPAPASAPLPPDLTAPLPPPPPPHRMASLPPMPPAPPAPPAPRWHDAGLNFVLITGDSRHVMSGNMGDVHAADSYRQGSEPLLWFRRNGHEYIVRDRATVNQAMDLWKPVNELGDAQGRIGEKQGALGAEQGAIGARQGEIGARQGRLGERQAELSSRAAELNARAMRARTEAERRDLEQSRQKLEAEMKALNDEMNALGRQIERENMPMNDLSRRMEVLGREMRHLSERMELASRAAEIGLAALIDKAVASGTAQQVR